MIKLRRLFAIAAAAALVASCNECPTCPGDNGDDGYEPEPPPSGLILTTPYLQAPTQTSMTVMWITRDNCRGSVEFDTDEAGIQNGTARRKMYAYDDGIATANTKTHRVTLDKLQPGTTYYYRIAAEKVIKYTALEKVFSAPAYSRVFSFTTPDDTSADFTILMLNDLHRQTGKAAMDKAQEKLHAMDYDLVVFNGDCLSDIDTVDDLVVWLNHYTAFTKNNQIPSVYLRGNHETRGAMSFLIRYYVDYVLGGESYGAMNWGDSRIMFLDPGEDKWDDHGDYKGMAYYEPYRKEQIPFIEAETASAAWENAARRIVFYHIPLHSTVMHTKGHFNPGASHWGALLNAADIDIAMAGHVHVWEYVDVNKSKWPTKNTYPEYIGGGPETNVFTLSFLEKKGSALTLRVLDTNGDELFKQEL